MLRLERSLNELGFLSAADALDTPLAEHLLESPHPQLLELREREGLIRLVARLLARLFLCAGSCGG